ncbi:MAG TPA: signal peptidase II [Acidobacteriota bacterium]|nr:signal peptidase II [Acidobacteriota bacterium]
MENHRASGKALPHLMGKTVHHPIWLYASIVFIFIIDRVLKYAAQLYFENKAPLTVIPDYLQLTFIYNDGIAFGLLAGYGTVLTLIVCLILVACVLIFRLLPNKYAIPLGVVIGGGLGNIYDRLIYGAVIDYISVPFFSVFNFADAAIFLGILWTLWRLRK